MKRFRMKAYLLFTLILGVLILPGCGGDAGNGHWDQPGTAPPGTLTAPTITGTFPANLEENIAIDVVLSATFSKPMNPLTMIDANFTLQASGPPLGALLPVTVVYDEIAKKATFTPNVPLDPDTFYTVMVTVDAKDTDGNALVVPAVNGLPVPNPWTFKTSSTTTTIIIPGATCSVASGPTIPTATMSDPTDGLLFVTTSTSGVVGDGKQITVTFDMAMDATTINDTTFTLTPQGGVALIPASVTYDALTNVATLTTSSALDVDTNYEVNITTDVTSAATPGVALACPYFWTFKTTTPAATGQLGVPLGAAANFAILASAGITNVPSSAITGDVGLTPDTGANIIGFADSTQIVGTLYAVDAAGPAYAVIDPLLLLAAKAAAADAFLDARAALRGTPTSISGNLNGLTLYPGLYESLSTIEISAAGFLYLDGQGDENAVFIIRSENSITTEASSQVILTNGTKANNVYWTAGSSVTLGTNSIMKGTLLAGTGISLLNGANLEGRAINQGPAAAAITLDQANITLPLP